MTSQSLGRRTGGMEIQTPALKEGANALDYVCFAVAHDFCLGQLTKITEINEWLGRRDDCS